MTDVYTIYNDEEVKEMDAIALVKAVETWAKERNLNTAEPSKQLLKLYEEVGEIGESVLDSDWFELKDAVGDTLVVLTVLSTQIFKEEDDKFQAEPVLQALMQPTIQATINDIEESELLLKLIESLGGISSVIARNQTGEYSEEESDKLDWLVTKASGTLCDLSVLLGVKGGATNALKQAYNVIKHRRGKLIDGVFVKESDLDG